MRIAIYQISSGAIQRITECPEAIASDQCLDGEAFLPCGDEVSDSSHYVEVSADPPGLVERGALNTAHTVAGLEVTFTDLPIGTTLKIDAATLVSDSQGAVIEFEVPGTYDIRLYPPPEYRDLITEVTVDG